MNHLDLFQRCTPRELHEVVTILHAQGGTSSSLIVYTDPSTGLDYLKCDVCSKLIGIKSKRVATPMTQECTEYQVKFEELFKRWQATLQAAEMAEVLFSNGGIFTKLS